MTWLENAVYICCVYAACLRPSCASTVEADYVEKHYGLAASTEWAGGLGLGLGGWLTGVLLPSGRIFLHPSAAARELWGRSQ